MPAPSTSPMTNTVSIVRVIAGRSGLVTATLPAPSPGPPPRVLPDASGLTTQLSTPEASGCHPGDRLHRPLVVLRGYADVRLLAHRAGGDAHRLHRRRVLQVRDDEQRLDRDRPRPAAGVARVTNLVGRL